MRQTLLFTALLAAAGVSGARAQTAADSASIRATAHDYIDGWYDGDGARMERALHPHLAKRLVYDDQNGHSHLANISALELVQSTRAGAGKIPPAQWRDSVTMLDFYGNAAMVRIDATTWVDFLEEVKWNGKWVIINVVWVNRPQTH